jgi:flavin reductase (DIM6/NTAB) family NADH-FMN oxidoreductase RutF
VIDDPAPEQFREAVSRFPTGLTVVTCRCDGVDHGMTASSFVSVSLDPLLVLVSVERATRFHDAVQDANEWSVSILPEQAVAAARWFATRGRPLADQFANVPHHRGRVTGTVILDGALAGIECRTWRSVPAGDHDLLVGEVCALELPDDVPPPLLYHRRSYRSLGPTAG